MISLIYTRMIYVARMLDKFVLPSFSSRILLEKATRNSRYTNDTALFYSLLSLGEEKVSFDRFLCKATVEKPEGILTEMKFNQ